MRNSSIELFRLLLMLLIIIHHAIVHGLGIVDMLISETITQHLTTPETITAITINSFCICAVNCFILISGYFSIKTDFNKLITLITTVVLYTLIFSVPFEATHTSIIQACKKLFFFSHPTYWFINCYIYLMVLAPAINMIFDTMSRKYQNTLTIFLLFISIYLGFVWGNTLNYNGYNLTQFITIYCIGRLMRNQSFSLSTKKGLSTYVVGSLLVATPMIMLISFGKYKWAWHMTYYNNPLLIITAIALFSIFKNSNYSNSLINKWASSALAIYMIQSSDFIEYYLYNFINSFQATNHFLIYPIILIIAFLIIFFSIVFDQVLLKPLTKRIVQISSTQLKRFLTILSDETSSPQPQS